MKRIEGNKQSSYLLPIILLGLFAVIASGVSLWPASAGYDSSLINLFSSMRGPALTPVMVFFTDLGEWYSIVLLVLISIVIFWRMNMTKLALALLISVIGGEAITLILKELFQRARPELLSQLVAESGYSFPSGHSFAAFSFYGFMTYILMKKTKSKNTKLIITLSGIALILLIGISRISLGVHWPSDVLGGYAIGAAWTSAIILYLKSKKELN